MLARTSIQFILGICLLTSHLAQSAPLPGNMTFALVNQYSVGGDGKWDLLAFDKKNRRLFISRSTHVQVMDADSGKLVGDIPGTDGVHGIAIAEDLNLGFTSNGKSNSVTAFDLTTLNVIQTIPVSGSSPDSIIYEPKSKHVVSFNGRSVNASVIDAVSLKELATIALPGKPELAVFDNAGNIFVNLEDKNEIAVIDGKSNKVLKTYALGKGVAPTGLAIDQKHHLLFSVCDNKLMEILDSRTGKIVSEVAIGEKPDSAAFDPKLGVAFSSNGEGTLTVVKEISRRRFSVSQTITTQKGAKTLAYDMDKHRAYLVTASFGETPAPTTEQPKPKPSIIPNSFVVLVVALNP